MSYLPEGLATNIQCHLENEAKTNANYVELSAEHTRIINELVEVYCQKLRKYEKLALLLCIDLKRFDDADHLMHVFKYLSLEEARDYFYSTWSVIAEYANKNPNEYILFRGKIQGKARCLALQKLCIDCTDLVDRHPDLTATRLSHVDDPFYEVACAILFPEE